MSSPMKENEILSANNEPVWDILIRLFHLALILLMPLLYWSASEGKMEIHKYSGITLLIILVIRIVWGMFGSQTSRFSSFLRSPIKVLNYSRSFFKRRSPVYKTHNPMGGYMVVAMLLILLVQASFGLFATDDIFFDGPLAFLIDYDLSITLTKLHRTLFDYILVFIVLHIMAVFWYQFYKKQGLIQSMIHGKKPSE